MVNWTMTTQQVSQVIICIIRRFCVMHTMHLRPDANATFCVISCCGQTISCFDELSLYTRAGTNTPSDEYDTYRDTGWRIRYVSRIHFFSEAKLGNG